MIAIPAADVCGSLQLTIDTVLRRAKVIFAPNVTAVTLALADPVLSSFPVPDSCKEPGRKQLPSAGRKMFSYTRLGALTAMVFGFRCVTAMAECPHPSQQITQDVSKEVTALSDTTNESFQKKANTVTTDVFSKYPNADHVAIATTMISIYCQVLLPSNIPIADKLDRLDRLEAAVTNVVGISIPLDKSVGPECSTEAAEVLRPVRALFEAWQALDVDQYLAQWGPNAISRSKYYVYKVSDLGPHRRENFGQYRNVDVIDIDPHITFVDHAKAVIKNVYTMRFIKRDGRVIEERNVGESYVLECSAQNQQWLIRENNDYLSESE
jgi:hypothetical protein